jgi:hypothetical protein
MAAGVDKQASQIMLASMKKSRRFYEHLARAMTRSAFLNPGHPPKKLNACVCGACSDSQRSSSRKRVNILARHLKAR